eukprot:CAMPEP_0197592382 /NCGR_PEP_ID=MMETSP1326-20131121/15064_1 /TAXON_ID=1155430 /ORGANISM="Genus nov. species nov., Strain RCC2288" /LENGTH=110 /DNA_ID=CAMNT_0043158073 /DNA_START=50 /DNA_END=382 /DNA_ORIENTATION=+
MAAMMSMNMSAAPVRGLSSRAVHSNPVASFCRPVAPAMGGRVGLVVEAASKKKDVRLVITLECTEQKAAGVAGISRYTTQKNRRNTSARIELMKYNSYLRKHTLHRELKK